MKKPAAGIEDNKILTPQQIHFIRLFLNSELKHFFRLTGGTALSAFYLEHRLSEALDFFSTEKIPLITIETLRWLVEFNSCNWIVFSIVGNED